MENEIRLQAPQPEGETHFTEFTKSHFVISGIGFAFFIVFFCVSSELPFFFVLTLIEVILLAFYAIAGFWCARKELWGFPRSFKEGLWIFLKPALVAWGWGALVVVSIFLSAWPLLMILFICSVLFASPSTLMVYLALTCYLLEGEAGFVLWAFLAGGIPPLLFTLGCLLGSRKQKGGAMNDDHI